MMSSPPQKISNKKLKNLESFNLIIACFKCKIMVSKYKWWVKKSSFKNLSSRRNKLKRKKQNVNISKFMNSILIGIDKNEDAFIPGH